MEKNSFIHYKGVKKILENHQFQGFTAKRENNKITYRFISIKWQYVTVSVETIRLNPNNLKSPRIVTAIRFNDTVTNDWKEFMEYLKNIYKTNKKLEHDKISHKKN